MNQPSKLYKLFKNCDISFIKTRGHTQDILRYKNIKTKHKIALLTNRKIKLRRLDLF